MRVRNLKNKKTILEESNYYLVNPEDYLGKWNEYFQNKNDIHLEIGCGKCSFLYELAKRNPDKNYIGVERIDTVLAYGIKEISGREKLPNLVLVNYDAESIDSIFKDEIETLYLNFSDPWPKKRHEKRRLTSFKFLEKYDTIFRDKKIIEFKTDNISLFEYSVVSLSSYGYTIKDFSLDLHKREDFDNIITEYERKFTKKGFKINYLKAVKSI